MNIAKDALHVLQTVAPTIARAALGPFGGLAATAISAILGTPPGDEQATSTALLTATPDQLLALKKAEQDFQVQMKELGISEEKLVYDDIANARGREIQLRDSTPRNLAYMLLGGTGVAIGATLAGYTHVESALAGTLIGYLISECKAVMQYYFGSSQSSQNKDATIASIAKQP
jgi:hypothetical protein